MTVAMLPLNFRNALFVIWVGLNRLRIRLSSNTHPFDPRFISGDAFRSLGDHIYEGQPNFDPQAVKERDIVFVSLPHIETYLQKIHPQIKNKYRLISHNGDTNIDKRYIKYIDKNILIWWTQNCLIQHPKVKPIPIGIENLSYFNHGIPSLLMTKKQKKHPNILCGFSVSTNPKVRSKVMKVMNSVPEAQSVPERLNSKEYFNVLQKYMFVASPPGNGEDCHRTWEALYLGAVPILMSSTMTEGFVRLGIPIWVIGNWKDLMQYSKKDLRQKYLSIKNKSNKNVVDLSYWIQEIQNS